MCIRITLLFYIYVYTYLSVVCLVAFYEGLVAARCLLFTFKFCQQRATKGRKRKGRGELWFDTLRLTLVKSLKRAAFSSSRSRPKVSGRLTSKTSFV